MERYCDRSLVRLPALGLKAHAGKVEGPGGLALGRSR
jgi:hypothetical protein